MFTPSNATTTHRRRSRRPSWYRGPEQAAASSILAARQLGVTVPDQVE